MLYVLPVYLTLHPPPCIRPCLYALVHKGIKVVCEFRKEDMDLMEFLPKLLIGARIAGNRQFKYVELSG